ncbi:DNA-binding HORMA [Pseudocohnilembus persalinus]|uniref:DNA-binding HORMA n=1 Tax=Pseudocohnilembus persalinus TaxID=266149 RepID=A0A0V0QM21_PSEPJ|nr:DNA-binding HORMA [Pseudocohnilembus persalinus]|eukprot:KRX03013.1 DNA-binding HORMA [Pseudocohnilembus persalinus]
MEYLTKQQELTTDLLNFIETFIHHLLYRRQLYPSNIFSQRTVYGISVFQAKKGVLFDYIHQLVEDIKPLLNNIEIIRINLESDGDIQEVFDLDIDKGLKFEDMTFINPKNERDIIFKKLIFNLDQKLVCFLGYDFSKNYYINSFNIEIITDGSQDQNANSKNCLIEKWILEKKLNDISDTKEFQQVYEEQYNKKTNQLFNQSQKDDENSQNKNILQNENIANQKMQNDHQNNTQETQEKEHVLIDSSIISQFNLGIFYSKNKNKKFAHIPFKSQDKSQNLTQQSNQTNQKDNDQLKKQQENQYKIEIESPKNRKQSDDEEVQVQYF